MWNEAKDPALYSSSAREDRRPFNSNMKLGDLDGSIPQSRMPTSQRSDFGYSNVPNDDQGCKLNVIKICVPRSSHFKEKGSQLRFRSHGILRIERINSAHKIMTFVKQDGKQARL